MESELFSVLSCPNNTLKNQREKGSATSTIAAIWNYSKKASSWKAVFPEGKLMLPFNIL